MTREIKFRAWQGVKENGKKSNFVRRMIDWSEISRKWSFNEFQNPKNYDRVLMQFTGLKDKNGTDIYEGDIVTIRFWHNNPPSKRPKIKYVDINLPVVFGNGSFHISDSPRIPQYGTRYGKEFEQCEIIGNVYQHPNLINQ